MRNLRIALTIIILTISLLAIPSWASGHSFIVSPTDPCGPNVFTRIYGCTEINPGETVTRVLLTIKRLSDGKYWQDSRGWVNTNASYYVDVRDLGNGRYDWEYTGISAQDFTHLQQYEIGFTALNINFVHHSGTHSFWWDAWGPPGTCSMDPSYLTTDGIYLRRQYFGQPVSFLLDAMDVDKPAEVTEMKIDFEKDGATQSTGWIPYANTYDYVIPAWGDGTYNYSATFKDYPGNIGTASLSQSFIVDSTPPEFTSFDTSNPITIINGNAYTNSKNINLSINGQDNLSGLDKMQITACIIQDNGPHWIAGSTIPYAPNYVFDLGSYEDGRYEFSCMLRDTVGNSSFSTNDPNVDDPVIYIDTTPPTNPDPLYQGIKWQNTPDAQIVKDVDFTAGEDPPCPFGEPGSGLHSYQAYVYPPLNQGENPWQIFPNVDLNAITWNMDREGIYQLAFQSVDGVGNSASEITLLQVGHDTTPPSDFNISSPIDGSTIDTLTPTVSWTQATDQLSGFDRYEIYHDGNLLGSTIDLSFNVPAGLLTIGSQTVLVKAYDNAGNYTERSTTFTIDIQTPADTEDPEIEISAPADGTVTNNAALEVQGSASDNCLITKIELNVNGDLYMVFSGSASSVLFDQVVDLTSGNNTITARAIDDSNNDAQTTITVICDTDQPAPFGLIHPEDNGWAVSQPTFEWEESSDALTGLKGYDLYVDNAKVNSELIADVSYPAPAPLADGNHSYYVVAWDNVGNSRESDTFTFQIDSTPPAAFNITSPIEGECIEEAFEAAWTESIDSVSGLAAYEVYIDGEKLTEVTVNSCQISEVPDDGNHNIYVVARDTAGNSTTSNTVNFVINSSAPSINLYVNNKLVKNGDRISSLPRIKAQISDKSGIDSSSIKIAIDGHEQENLSLDATQIQASVITDCEVNKNNVSLEPGKHSIKVEAKDILGKKRIVEVINLDVRGYAAIEGRPMNYPNPFKPSYGETTKIAYTLTDDTDIVIKIYNLAGRQVHNIFCPAGTLGGGGGENDVPWDGKSTSGNILGNGVYIYLITSKGSVLGTGEIAIYE